MELFYAYKVGGGYAYLDSEESYHCVRVLRHSAGDSLNIIDGQGTLLHCTLKDASFSAAVATIVSEEPGWGGHPYYLRMAVCPTKNMDRYEWFVEKATELGVDEIVPVIGEHSERRVVRVDRLQKIAVSAAKQSLKGAIPVIAEPVSVLDFIASCPSEGPDIRLIAYCSDDVSTRGSIIDALTAACVTVLIGPEGDFSQEEVRAAVEAVYLTLGLGTPAYDSETAGRISKSAVPGK